MNMKDRMDKFTAAYMSVISEQVSVGAEIAKLLSLCFEKTGNSSYVKDYNGMKLVFFNEGHEWSVYFISPWGKTEYGPEETYGSLQEAIDALIEWTDAIKQEAEEDGTDPDLIKAAEMAVAELK